MLRAVLATATHKSGAVGEMGLHQAMKCFEVQLLILLPSWAHLLPKQPAVHALSHLCPCIHPVTAHLAELLQGRLCIGVCHSCDRVMLCQLIAW